MYILYYQEDHFIFKNNCIILSEVLIMANNPTALDFNDLIYYDKKIKEYVDDKANSIEAIIPDTYTKDEIDSKLDISGISSLTIDNILSGEFIPTPDQSDSAIIR